jgi:small neutral amino acid transporter SnatA (MarC family)
VLGVSTRADNYRDYPAFAVGIALIALTVFLVLAFSHRIIGRLGLRGMHALNQIFGFLIIAIAAELILHGVKAA